MPKPTQNAVPGRKSAIDSSASVKVSPEIEAGVTATTVERVEEPTPVTSDSPAPAGVEGSNGSSSGIEGSSGRNEVESTLKADEAAENTRQPRLPFPVVGVGASAGGLEAYIELLRALPPNPGMSLVLVQHLSPERESMLTDILSKYTRLPLRDVEDNMPVLVNHIYVIRPGHTLTIRDGRLHLGQSVERAGNSRPVDDFFRSLAEEQRERAICVILSGMGSNGTAGAKAVRSLGGVCIAQDPSTAKFPAMPRSLISANGADFIVRPSEIVGVLMSYSSHPYVNGDPAPTPEDEYKDLAEIVAILRIRTKHDFSGYKRPTLMRRVRRRMSLAQVSSVQDYIERLRAKSDEVLALADDLTIHVTGFFRDAPSWEALTSRVIEPLVRARPNETPIRAWVTACSTGEEAYTLAMLLVEAAEAAKKKFDIKIFATDTGEQSLSQARTGLYAGGIESELSPDRLKRFFEKDDAFYRVNQELREMIVFAPQNVLQDPPFSRLDICTCRNLLIYLEPALQKRLLSLLHFGLCEGGTLFLGSSETINHSEVDSLFEPVDKQHRIYRRIGLTRHGAVDFPLAALPATLAERERQVARPEIVPSITQLSNQVLLESYTPPAVTIDRDQCIVFYHGQTEPFIAHPRGEPTQKLLTLVREKVRGAVRIALLNAGLTDEPAPTDDGIIDTPDGPARVTVTASPLHTRLAPGYFVVSFTLHPVTLEVKANRHPADGQTEGTDGGDRLLRDDLQLIREELQSTIEELQTSNEELKASNEEITSINEELQSSNEELETSKEELQSLNEELITVNAQLQTKMEELEEANNDLSSLLSSTSIAVIFLDTRLHIRRFTPATRDLVDLIQSDVGRPLSDLAPKFSDPDLTADVVAVLDKLVPIEREVSSESGRWYMRRALPYRTINNRIEGVVITFVDVTARHSAQHAQRVAEDRLTRSAAASGIGDWEIQLPSRKLYWSTQARRLLGVEYDAPSDFRLVEAVVHSDDRDLIGQAVARASAAGSDGNYRIEFRIRRPGGEVVWIESRGKVEFRHTPQGPVPSLLRGTLADISEHKTTESTLAAARDATESANVAKDQFLANVSHELRTPLAAILLWSRILRMKETTPGLLEGLDAIQRSAENQQTLIEDLLDTTRISTGRLRLELSSVRLIDVVTEAVKSIQPTADLKRISITLTCAADAGDVLADGLRLQQILWNLLNNSVKFTPTGGRVSLELTRDGDAVTFNVSDNGCGISADVLPLIFDRFKQAEITPQRQGGGLGLGLAITRQLVQVHGGTISVASDGPQMGATFTVVLPLPRILLERTPSARIDIRDRLKDTVVLLVEDDALTHQALLTILTAAGATVLSARTAEEAVELFKTGHPNLILSDIGLPQENGYWLMRQIRNAEVAQKSSRTPAVALTALTRPGDRRRTLESGFDIHLPKPLDAERIITELAALRVKSTEV